MSITRPSQLGPQHIQMRCLSLKQPYLHFIFDLPPEHRKDIENRTRSVTSEPGPILFAASATTKRDYFDLACEGALKRGVPEALLPKYEQIEKGVLYGCVRITQVLPSTSMMDHLWKWKFPGHTGYVLKDAVRLAPRQLSGQQTLFYVDLDPKETRTLKA